MIKCFRKIKEVGYFDLDLETNKYILKKGVLVGIDRRCNEYLLIDSEAKNIERVSKKSILHHRILKEVESLLEKDEKWSDI